MPPALLHVSIVISLAAVSISGCLGSPDGDAPSALESTPGTAEAPAETSEGEVEPTGEPEDGPNQTRTGEHWRSGPRAVIGFSDSGINPYHIDFRDDSEAAWLHPSTYIPGYPRDAQALKLSLDAPDYRTALEQDADVWASVQGNTLYWVPGTRIVALTNVLSPSESPVSTGEDDCPLLLDCSGHGTMVASRGAGASHSLCPTCLIASVQDFTEGYVWLGEQLWVDVISNSWGFLAPFPQYRAMDELAQSKPTFFGTGNGIGGVAGVAGQPSPTMSTAGPHAISVGGHDNGYLTLWSGSMPHVVADACWSWAADNRDMTAMGPRIGSGTSAATPYAAGAAARLLLEARIALGDIAGGIRDGGVLAQGHSGAIEGGPLSDGTLDQPELKTLLFRTADPELGTDENDGDHCSATARADPERPQSMLHTTSPVAPADLPADLPLMYFIGYGTVNAETTAHALDALLGLTPIPDRPVEQAWFELDHELRTTIHDVSPG